MRKSEYWDKVKHISTVEMSEVRKLVDKDVIGPVGTDLRDLRGQANELLKLLILFFILQWGHWINS